MYRQVGPFALDENGVLRSGLLIRHLILPGQAENTRYVIDWVSESFEPGTVLFSLMSQYTPCGDLSGNPELSRPITEEEYDACLRYLQRSPISAGFIQDRASSGKGAIPAFDLTGVC
jgi:putative pyruvate formate lyase activating enzyme